MEILGTALVSIQNFLVFTKKKSKPFRGLSNYNTNSQWTNQGTGYARDQVFCTGK